MKWFLAPLATAVAVAIGYILYTNERANTANPLTPWFDHEDGTAASFAEHIGLDPRRWNG